MKNTMSDSKSFCTFVGDYVLYNEKDETSSVETLSKNITKTVRRSCDHHNLRLNYPNEILLCKHCLLLSNDRKLCRCKYRNRNLLYQSNGHYDVDQYKSLSYGSPCKEKKECDNLGYDWFTAQHMNYVINEEQSLNTSSVYKAKKHLTKLSAYFKRMWMATIHEEEELHEEFVRDCICAIQGGN